MKTQETEVKVLNKELKTGVNASGKKWEMNEYILEENMEREDGSVTETKLVATTSQAVGNLEIGATYKVVIYITSRETEKDGKKSIWNSFRVTRADKISDGVAEKPSEAQTVVEAINDEIPFNNAH